jgi:hypothetical protein
MRDKGHYFLRMTDATCTIRASHFDFYLVPGITLGEEMEIML